MFEQESERGSDAKWQAWLAKGRAHDRRVQHKVRVFGLVLLVVATLSMAGVLVLR